MLSWLLTAVSVVVFIAVSVSVAVIVIDVSVAVVVNSRRGRKCHRRASVRLPLACYQSRTSPLHLALLAS